MPGDEQTYAAAGVSLATADAVVERLRAAVDSTRTPGVHGAFGGFAGLYALDDERLLAASTDSVGTKLVLARRAGTLRWCGADLAAHGINDVATTGAEPLFFLDYVAATSLAYLSLDGMQWATRLPEESVCRACFTRRYPTAVPPERSAAKLRFEATAL